MNRYERVLVILLRVSGTITGLAVFTIFLPTAWMAATHEFLGLGPFHDSAIMQYLTRSCSALYAVLGAFKWFVSFDVRRHAPVVAFIGWITIAFGLVMLGIDLDAGMPWHWTASEGPFLVLLGAVIVWLVRKMEAESAGTAGPTSAPRSTCGRTSPLP